MNEMKSFESRWDTEMIALIFCTDVALSIINLQAGRFITWTLHGVILDAGVQPASYLPSLSYSPSPLIDNIWAVVFVWR